MLVLYELPYISVTPEWSGKLKLMIPTWANSNFFLSRSTAMSKSSRWSSCMQFKQHRLAHAIKPNFDHACWRPHNKWTDITMRLLKAINFNKTDDTYSEAPSGVFFIGNVSSMDRSKPKVTKRLTYCCTLYHEGTYATFCIGAWYFTTWRKMLHRFLGSSRYYD